MAPGTCGDGLMGRHFGSLYPMAGVTRADIPFLMNSGVAELRKRPSKAFARPICLHR